MTRLIWVLPPEVYFKSGVGKYSINLISHIEKSFLIDKVFFKGSPKSVLRYFWQFFYLPFYLLLNYRKVDKIVFYDESLTYLSCLFPRKAVLIVHDVRTADKSSKSIIQNLKSKIVYFFLNIAAKCALIIVPSEFTRDSIKLISHDCNCKVVYNSVEVTRYNDLTLDSNVVDDFVKIKDRVKVLFVGSCEDRKNLDVLIDAFKYLPTHFVLVRVGPELTNEMKKNKNDVFCEKRYNSFYDYSNVSESTLSYIYDGSDLLVMPSSFEGFGRPVVEAQAHGTLVLSTNNTALKEVCSNSTFKIRDEKNSFELAKDILNSINSDEKDRYIQCGYQNALRFSTENVADVFVEAIGCV